MKRLRRFFMYWTELKLEDAIHNRRHLNLRKAAGIEPDYNLMAKNGWVNDHLYLNRKIKRLERRHRRQITRQLVQAQ